MKLNKHPMSCLLGPNWPLQLPLHRAYRSTWTLWQASPALALLGDHHQRDAVCARAAVCKSIFWRVHSSSQLAVELGGRPRQRNTRPGGTVIKNSPQQAVTKNHTQQQYTASFRRLARFAVFGGAAGKPRTALSLFLTHHEEGEIAIAEQAEDDERQGEEAEPQHDVHVLFSHGTHDPGVEVGKTIAKG